MISMRSPLRRSLDISFEADELELEFGRAEAIEVVGLRILEADRSERRRLYKLHDELTRRAAMEEEAAQSGPPPLEVRAELIAA
ncbi:MAG TPA: hypothetical protein VIO94_14060 [Phenylobacterium sp.]